MTDSDRDDGGVEALEWTMRVPMVGDRFFVLDILRWVLLTGVLVTVLIAVIGIAADAPRMLPTVLLQLWAILAGLFTFSLLIALVVFRNRYFMHYRLDPRGAHAAAGRDVSVAWDAVRRVAAYGAPRVLALKNGWRTLFRLRCADDESFARVKSYVTARREEIA